jgi:hypothetical protein
VTERILPSTEGMSLSMARYDELIECERQLRELRVRVTFINYPDEKTITADLDATIHDTVSEFAVRRGLTHFEVKDGSGHIYQTHYTLREVGIKDKTRLFVLARFPPPSAPREPK